MTYKKAFFIGGLMPIFALTGCDNAEKKETEKTVVETPTVVPVTPAPATPKDMPKETPATTDMSHDAVKTPMADAPSAPVVDPMAKSEHDDKTVVTTDGSMKKMNGSMDMSADTPVEEPSNK